MTQRGQSVATPERGTAPGRARARGLAQEGQVVVSPHSDPRQDGTVRNTVKGNKKSNAAVSIQGPKGNESYRKKAGKHTANPNTVDNCTSASARVPRSAHCKQNDNVQVPHRKERGTVFCREATVPTPAPPCSPPL